jgi:hypothetical protein
MRIMGGLFGDFISLYNEMEFIDFSGLVIPNSIGLTDVTFDQSDNMFVSGSFLGGFNAFYKVDLSCLDFEKIPEYKKSKK